MAKQLLIYERITPLSADRHATWSAREVASFSFAAGINSVPLMASEFAFAAAHYPIVFAFDGQNAHPIVVLGIDSDRNLCVEPDGRWRMPYVPAFIRRYPFVFSATPDGATLTLCIDEAYAGFDPHGRTGERLFDDLGGRTPFLERALEFTNAFQAEHRAASALGGRLRELGLLENNQASFTLASGETKSLSGFQCVSREQLKALDAGALSSLVASDVLELIYLHLFSLRNFESLFGLAQPAPQIVAAPPADA